MKKEVKKPKAKSKSKSSPSKQAPAPKTLGEHGLQNYQHPDVFGKWLGYRVTARDRVKHIVEGELEIRHDHLSPAARVHGGVIAAFFDWMCGAAVFTTMQPQDFCSTVDLKVNYFRPLELGDVLRARAEVVFRGKRLCTVQSLLYRGEATEPAAMATATYNIVSDRGQGPTSPSPARTKS